MSAIPIQTRQQYAETFETACFPVWTVDATIAVCYCNRFAQQQYAAHCLPDGVRLFFAPQDMAAVALAIEEGRSLTVEPSVLARQDTHLAITPFDSLEGRGAYVMLTPAPARQEEQQELWQALEGAGNLVLTQALRRSMSDILGALSSCTTRLHGAGIELVDDQLGLINRSCYQLMRTTGNLSEQIKFGAGLTAGLQCLDFWESIAQLLDACNTLLRSSKLSFSYSLPDSTVWVNCDFDKLVVALLNLLSNSYQYGGPKTHVTITGRDSSDSVLLTITDDGPGIPQELQERLFQPFITWDRPERADAGMGLGLHLVRKIVAEAGGRVALNTGSTGTAVVLSLPLDDQPHPEAPQLRSSSLAYLQDRFSSLYFGLCDVVDIPSP